MMNPSQIAEVLKTVPDQYLAAATQGDLPQTPGYLALAEMKRRQSLRQQATPPAPVTTVAQDQRPAMGIGGVQGFADGGVVQRPWYQMGSDITYPDPNVDTGPLYGDVRILEWLKNLGLRTPIGRAKAAQPSPPTKFEGPWRGRDANYEAIMPFEGAWRGRDANYPPTIMGPDRGGISAAGKGSGSGSGVGGMSNVKPGVLKTYEDLMYKDPSTMLGKVPISEILKTMEASATPDKEAQKRKRGEAYDEAMAKFGALIASRPGGLGGNFARSVSGALDHKRSIDKELTAEEQAAQDRFDRIRAARAAEETQRFNTAREMTKDEYGVNSGNRAFQYNASKDAEDLKYKYTDLNARIQMAREQNASMLAAAKERAASTGRSNPEIMRLTLAEKAIDDAHNYMRARQEAYDKLPQIVKMKTPPPSAAELDQIMAQRYNMYIKMMGLEGTAGISAMPVSPQSVAPSGRSFVVPQGANIRE